MEWEGSLWRWSLLHDWALLHTHGPVVLMGMLSLLRLCVNILMGCSEVLALRMLLSPFMRSLLNTLDHTLHLV